MEGSGLPDEGAARGKWKGLQYGWSQEGVGLHGEAVNSDSTGRAEEFRSLWKLKSRTIELQTEPRVFSSGS